MNKPIRLLECPFCGGEAALNTIRITCKETIKANGQDVFYGVNCIRCGGNLGLFGRKTPEAAADHWNHRESGI